MPEPVVMWVRRYCLIRADETNKAIRVGTRVKVIAHPRREAPVPVGSVGRVVAAGVKAAQAIRAVGTTNAFLVDFDSMPSANQP